jgi:hypothetical protein
VNGSFFKVARIEAPEYLAWVRSLPCWVCNSPFKSDAHHRIGHGRCGSVKTDDLEAMPLCPACHRELHDNGWHAFEEVNGPQSELIVKTVLQAYRQGVLVMDRKVAKGIAG